MSEGLPEAEALIPAGELNAMHTGAFILLENIKSTKKTWGRILYITHSHNGQSRICALANGSEHTMTMESTKPLTVKEK